MARLARDVLSVPASGAGVERLFNSARDLCHYRRGSLQPQTISDLMMYMCASQFEIHEEERIMLSEYLSAQEIQAAKEERTQQQITVDPISDNEEDEGSSAELQTTSHGLVTLQGPSANSLGKRRLRNMAENIESDQEDDSEVTSLPDIQHRVSGRVRKRSRLLDGYQT
jgi:hAT family protein